MGLSWRSLGLVGAGVLLAFILLFVTVWLVTDRLVDKATWEPRGISDDGRTLTVVYLTGPCDSLDRVETVEKADTVVVTVVVSEPEGGCEDRGVYHTTEVELSRPLGDRTLLDGGTGSEPEFFPAQ